MTPRTGFRDELTLQDCFNEDIVLFHRKSRLNSPSLISIIVLTGDDMRMVSSPESVLCLCDGRSSWNYPGWERLPGHLDLVRISTQGVGSLTGIIACQQERLTRTVVIEEA